MCSGSSAPWCTRVSTTYNAQCRCCTSPQRAAIDNFLLSGASLRDTAERTGVSPTSLHRHLHHHVGEHALIAARVRREVVALVRDVLTLMRRRKGDRDVAILLRDLGFRAGDYEQVHQEEAVHVHQESVERPTAPPPCPHCGATTTRAIGVGGICYSCGLDFDWSRP